VVVAVVMTAVVASMRVSSALACGAASHTELVLDQVLTLVGCKWCVCSCTRPNIGSVITVQPDSYDRRRRGSVEGPLTWRAGAQPHLFSIETTPFVTIPSRPRCTESARTTTRSTAPPAKAHSAPVSRQHHQKSSDDRLKRVSGQKSELEVIQNRNMVAFSGYITACGCETQSVAP
jgi:hypothetical protein